MANNSDRQADSVTKAYDQLLERFLNWAKGEDNIQAVVQIGSRVRQDHPGDEWADMDLMLYLTTPDAYVHRTDWLEAVAPVWMALPARTAGNDPELLVMFEGGYNVDFVFCLVGALDWLRDHADQDMVYQRGGRVLLDRDGLAGSAIPAKPTKEVRHPPSKEEFTGVCNAFWYASVYIARQIRRGDLWVAKLRDGQQKAFLLQMLEWHAGAKSQWQRDTWHTGRFIGEWADPRALREIRHIFGGYEAASAAPALLASLNLFDWLARETATALNVAYPEQTEERVMSLLHEALGDS